MAKKPAVKAPLIWLLKTKSDSVNCVTADSANVWCGTWNGLVYQLGHDGSCRATQRVSSPVRELVCGGDSVFVGCQKGTVEKLTPNGPSIVWRTPGGSELRGLALVDHTLAVLSAPNRITLLDQTGETLWEREEPGYASLVMRGDEHAIYSTTDADTNREPVAAYSRETGERLWSVAGVNAQAGALLGASLVLGTVAAEVVVLNTSNGTRVWARNTAQQAISCATSGNAVFVGDIDARLYAWDETGKDLWQMMLPGSTEPTCICHHEDRLYVASATGSLACVDVNPVAIDEARNGHATRPRIIKAPVALG